MFDETEARRIHRGKPQVDERGWERRRAGEWSGTGSDRAVRMIYLPPLRTFADVTDADRETWA